MEDRKIYKTVFRFEVLSSEPITESVSLKEIAEETYDGSWSGQFLDNEIHNQELNGEDADAAIRAQGSEPSFFFGD